MLRKDRIIVMSYYQELSQFVRTIIINILQILSGNDYFVNFCLKYFGEACDGKIYSLPATWDRKFTDVLVRNRICLSQ